MAASANWDTKVITIPLSDLTFVSAGRYSLTSNFFWQLLRELAGSEEGIAETYTTGLYPVRRTAATATTPPITEVINGYSIFFGGGPYVLDIIEGNTNLGEPAIHPAGDNVSVNTNNVAGQVVSGSAVLPSDIDAIADQVWREQLSDHSGEAGSTAEGLAGAGGGSTPSQIADAVWANRAALTFLKWIGLR